MQNALKSQEPLDLIFSYYQQFGFQKSQILTAYRNARFRESLINQELMKISIVNIQRTFSFPSKLNQSEIQIKQAISLSLKTEEDPCSILRKDFNLPTGLMNLGRTCYFNVIVQTLFNIPMFRDLLFNLNLDEPEEEEFSEQNQNQTYFQLLQEFQLLFANMIKGRQVYQNPSQLFQNFRKTNGEYFKIGEENDFFEFQNFSFELLEKCFESLLKLKQNSKSEILKTTLIAIEKTEYFSKEQINKNQVQQQNNPISDLFYGTVQECIIYNHEKNEIKKYNEYAQGIINLNVKHQELYKAFDAFQNFQISDYEITEDLKVHAKIENRIKDAPQILNFYINRLDFDKTDYCPYKINDSFYFDKQIFIENFSVQKELDNQQGLNAQQSGELKKIDKQIEKIKEKLNEFQVGLIESSFTNIISYLSKQQQDNTDFLDFDEFELDCCENKSLDFQLNSTVELIKFQQSKQLAMKQKYVSQLEKLNKQKQLIYEQQIKYIYNLFSILMHDGSANSGHYYCYIFNEQSKKWFKYNDRIVSEADEEDLLIEAFGKEGSQKSACCLFYKNQNQAVSEEQSQILSQRLMKQVQINDKCLTDKIDFHKIQNQIEPVSKLFSAQVEQAKTQLEIQNNNQTSLCKYAQFDQYLLSFEEFFDIGKYEILIALISQKMAENDFKSSLFDQNNVEICLRKAFPEHYPLKNQSEYDELKLTHKSMCTLVYLFNQILIMFEDIMQYVQAMHQLGSLIILLSGLNTNMIGKVGIILKQELHNIMKIQLLKGCFNIDFLLQLNLFDDILSIQNIICACLGNFFKNDELLESQIRNNFYNTINTFTKLKNAQFFNEKTKKDFDINIKNIKNGYVLQSCIQFSIQEINDPTVLFQEFTVNLQNSLKRLAVWGQFIDQLQKNKMVIKQQERINQEELLYLNYLNE